MNPTLDAALVKDHPHLFRERVQRVQPPQTPLAERGIECGDGWEPLVRRLAAKLEPFARDHGLRAVQVKNKFGELRIYVRIADDDRVLPDTIAETVRAVIGAAVKESRITCERCGAARPTRRDWSALCPPCLEREQARRAERRQRWLRPDVAPGARVWLDDVRPAPEGWTWVLWPQHAIGLLQTHNVVELSLDHDLGDDDVGTGYDVLVWVEEQVALHGFVPPKIAIHSANVVGRARMEQAIASIERLLAARGK